MSKPLSASVPMNVHRRFVIIANGTSVVWFFEKDTPKTHPELVADFCTQYAFSVEQCTEGNVIRNATHATNGNITVIAGGTIHLDSVKKIVNVTDASKEYGGDRPTMRRFMPLLVGFDPSLATWQLNIHDRPVEREPGKVLTVEPD